VTDEQPFRVAIVDDNKAARLSIGQMLQLRGYEVELFAGAEAALAWPGLAEVDCIITDVKMPGTDGEQLLGEVLERGYAPPVIMITGHGDVAMAVRCLKTGAYDFVEKPFEDDVLLASVGRAAEAARLRRESKALRERLELLAEDEDGRFGMVGRSVAMNELYEQVEVAARSSAPVLIVGETGVGKELVARAIHAQSARANGPFIPVNVGALPETMLESELFGHARGAFTGADADRDGKLVSASGGTLFLDEVESISKRAQVQLLRVLEDGQVHPLGSDKTRHVDVRFLAATKVDLADMVRQGSIREDFYHRIVVLSIVVPALRERSDDVPLLIAHFLKRTATAQGGAPLTKIPEVTLAAMVRHPWPGNVRELKNAIERMIMSGDDDAPGGFAPDESFMDTTGGSRLLSLPATPGLLNDALEQTERQVIENALRSHRGEVNTTAHALGISRRALYERMKKYELMKEDFRL